MALDEAVKLLDAAAINGEIDNIKWSDLLDSVLVRLDNIVFSTFPIPTVPSSPKFNHLSPTSSLDPIASQQTVSSAIDKGSPSGENNRQISQSGKQLPTALQEFYDGIKSNLVNTFAAKPPYTIQRLAELLLVPTEHYRTLPAFLRAVDKVVSVSSTADLFPLPYTALDTNGTFGAGHDDFNGAALSRIPWLKDEKAEWLRDSADMLGIDDRVTGTNTDLRTESTALIDGPNGAGSIETVTVAVNGTGRVPSQSAVQMDQSADAHISEGSDDSLDDQGLDDPAEESLEDVPHVRGPEEIGVEDMGPQKVSNAMEAEPTDSIQAMERAVGRPGEAQKVTAEVDDITKEKADADSMSIAEEEKNEKADEVAAKS